MEKERDHWKYDYLSIAVKLEQLEEILGCYRFFRWEEIEREQDDRFDNVFNVTLRREHKIPNKDRLQLLQVNLEAKINELSLKEKSRNVGSLSFGVLSGFAGLVVISLGVSVIRNFSNGFKIPLGVFLIVAGISVILLSVPFIRKMISREEIRYTENSIQIRRNIAEICHEAERLCGDGK